MQYPDTATFLTPVERQLVFRMLQEENGGTSRFDRKFIWEAMTDYKTYLQLGIQMGCVRFLELM